MSTDDLSQDLARLAQALRTTFQQIARFSKLGSDLSAATDDSDSWAELASDIHENLKQHKESFELLNQDIRDLVDRGGAFLDTNSDKGRQRVQLVARAARLDEDVQHARGQFRKAQLAAQRTFEAAKQRQREDQFESLRQAYSEGIKDSQTAQDLFAGRRQRQNKELTEDELLVNASSDVTLSLRRTHELLSTELSKSRFAQETLDQSTAALAELGQRYTSLDDLLSSSKNLLGTLLKSQKSDTWYLETAFYILVVTLSWLVFRRIIYGPAWWFIWLPLKHFLLRPIYWVLSSLGVFGAATVTSAVGLAAGSSTTRAPLVVQPSATGGIPRHNHARGPVEVRAGAGGGSAKAALDGQRGQEETLQEHIARMTGSGRPEADHDREVDDSRSSGKIEHGDTRPGNGEVEANEEVIRRGDGTVLPPRGSDNPSNPKKKMLENEPQESVADGPKDEL